MLTTNYIKIISIIETGSENTKSIRFWTLNLPDDLTTFFLANLSIETTNFMRSVALNDIKDYDYLTKALKFITNNHDNNNISLLTQILILYPSNAILELSSKLKKLEQPILKAIISLLEAKPITTHTLKFLETIIETSNNKAIEVILQIYKSHTPLDAALYDYFLTKLKTASEEVAPNILIEFNTFCNDIIKRNADIYSLTTEEFLKSLEQCPDLLLKDTTIDTLEIAASRYLKRQAKEIF